MRKPYKSDDWEQLDQQVESEKSSDKERKIMDVLQRYRAIRAVFSFHYQTRGQLLMMLLGRQYGRKITEDPVVLFPFMLLN